MDRYRSAFVTPPVVKNLLIVNALFFLAEILLPNGLGDALVENLGLYSVQGEKFRLYQIITYMFLHDGFGHLFFNMFALWMFGRALEYDMGSKRFLTFYMVCGIGAGLVQLGVQWWELNHLVAQADAVSAMVTQEMAVRYYSLMNTATIGASGAVFGILLGFGMMHPNTVLMLLIPPIPIKAKYFVILYGILELYLGISGKEPGVAHFAHLGGLLWGFLLLWYWKKTGKIYF